MKTYGKYPDAFYRVTLKALIRNKSGHILMVKERSDEWDLPGGGWQHGETYDSSLRRELAEEIDYHGDIEYKLEDLTPIYSANHKACILFVIFNVELLDDYIPRLGIDSSTVEFVDPAIFLNTDSRMAELINLYVNKRPGQIEFEKNK